MNYIGSKHSLLSFLEKNILEISGIHSGVFVDGFAGTGAVGKHFQNLGFDIIANDIQYYSFVVNHGKLKVPSESKKSNEVITQCNNLLGKEGFIYKNYCTGGTKDQEFERMYFSDENGKKCDAIRQFLEQQYQQKSITTDEYFFLLFSLLESIDRVANTASVYGAFLKHLKKSAQKELKIPLLKNTCPSGNAKIYNTTIEKLITNISGDILYLDPPYNQRQYAPNYHVLETIARYDNPVLRGKTGLREYQDQKSDFCVKSKVKEAFEYIIKNADVQYIFLSYNNEGLMTEKEIQEILKKYGTSGVEKQEYGRFKADKTEKRNHSAKSVVEYLHWVKKN